MENVQPKNLEVLSQHSFKVIVFVGESQTKLPFDLVAGIQKFGNDAKYVKIAGNGKNSLDFHIAYYLVKLAAEEPDEFFHIISKDTGFDPLIKHLRENKVKVHRETDLVEIPVLRISNTSSKDETINAIVKNLAGRGQSRPRKVKTLINTINSLFAKKLDDKEMMSLLQSLRDRKYIVINDVELRKNQLQDE
ncbi:PIN domain-containing protein [uncultured Desulfobacter sp.]|uniref:PIN domain-containing protein n=1 Tax=uncultured Desulfobacter sp. TaxID=240139 RepID=UPI0029F48F09|nr:PIN domain-containing protein [uncultured Desulfobacter sp.]